MLVFYLCTLKGLFETFVSLKPRVVVLLLIAITGKDQCTQQHIVLFVAITLLMN